MGQVRWTEEAGRWLREIHDYITADNPEAAQRTVRGIYEKAQLLRRFPELGYRHETRSGQNVRILLYGHYRIAYLIKDHEDIDVLGVFHGALDLERHLKLFP